MIVDLYLMESVLSGLVLEMSVSMLVSSAGYFGNVGDEVNGDTAVRVLFISIKIYMKTLHESKINCHEGASAVICFS